MCPHRDSYPEHLTQRHTVMCLQLTTTRLLTELTQYIVLKTRKQLLRNLRNVSLYRPYGLYAIIGL